MKWEKKKAESFASKINFAKMGGLAPAIAQDRETKDVLMLAFMDKGALVKTLTSGFMHYFSRSRKRIWKKGEESGNVQQVVSVKADCDSDSLLFSVRQKGPACHTGQESCFGEREFDLLALAKLIAERKRGAPTGSYTAKLLSDKRLAIAKVREESEEFIEATEKKGRGERIWEACDLLYHSLALAGACGITPSDINKELKKRHLNRK
jgi:phosphoribosyl-ATP pyrophosphohydrolase/phosphoribosyl-AMP cyclohydrolase